MAHVSGDQKHVATPSGIVGWFFHSFHKLLLRTYYMPGPLPDPGESRVNQTQA